jgi:hypothetical protein
MMRDVDLVLTLDSIASLHWMAGKQPLSLLEPIVGGGTQKLDLLSCSGLDALEFGCEVRIT